MAVEPAVLVELDVDARVLAQQPGHDRVAASSSAHVPPRPAILRQRRFRIGDGDPTDAILAVGQGEPGELPAEPGRPRGLWHEQRELLAGGRGRAPELQLQALDRGDRRLPFEPGEQQTLDRLRVRGGLREALLDLDPRRRVARREGEVELQGQVRPVRGKPSPGELGGKGVDESVEDEAERLQLLDRRLDGQGEGQALGRVARPERVGLLAAGTGVQPSALVTEPGDERRPRQVRHGTDPAQPEALESRPDVRVGGQQRRTAGRRGTWPRPRAGR